MNKITIAVKLGKQASKNYHYILVIGAMFCGFLFGILYYVEPYNFLFLISYVPLIMHLKKIKLAENPNDFDSQLKILALTTFIFSILLGIGYLLH